MNKGAGINDNRYFRSTSGQTSDKKFTKKKLLHQMMRLEILNTMITREDMDEIDLLGTKVPKNAQLLNILWDLLNPNM